jgi:hypothetical protein
MRGHGCTLPIGTVVERLEIQPRLLTIGSRRHKTLMARPTHSNIRDKEDSKHMSYIHGSDLSKGIPRKAPAHPRTVHTSRLSTSLCISRKQALGITCQWTLIRTNVQLLPGHL